MIDYDFECGVFGVNEAALIGACLRSIDAASEGLSVHVSVILNGSTDASLDVVKSIALSHAALSVYTVAVADKANALNYFLHELRTRARLYCCIDAYATVGRMSFAALQRAFAASPQALIASAIPITGRSARRVAERSMQGGLVNGQFFALRPGFVERLAESRLKLPLQLYRVDGLLGSMGAHDLDALGQPWDDARLIGVADATFAITPLSILRWRDIRRQYRREIRQARGRLENQAIKQIIYHQGYAGLPDNADDMILQWLAAHHPPAGSLRERFFLRLARRQLGAARLNPVAPRLVLEAAPGRRVS